MPATPLPSTAKKNVELIAEVEKHLLGGRSRIDRIGNAVGRFFGTLQFVIAHVVFFAVWFILNTSLIATIQPFDPYPFPFLDLIVTIEFIFLTTCVLINQNLQARHEEQWAHLNLQLAMLTEHEVTKSMQMLSSISTRLGIKDQAEDHEVQELAKATPVTTLVEEIAQKLGETSRTVRLGD